MTTTEQLPDSMRNGVDTATLFATLDAAGNRIGRTIHSVISGKESP